MTEDAKPQWIFPRVPCPRCRAHDTIATHTDSTRGIQYRKCRRAICRWKFSVKGAAAERPAALMLQCPHCEKTYERQSSLTKHLQRQHKGEATNG